MFFIKCISSVQALVSMKTVVQNHPSTSLDEALTSELPFKIAVSDQRWVDHFPNTLCLGRAEYDYNVDQWLVRSCTFPSETAVTSLDQMWIGILHKCLGGVALYLNQHDPSSAVRIRQDTTLMKDGALLLKGEAKRDETEMESAKQQLLDSFFEGALACFPRSYQGVVGVTTCSTAASIYRIRWSDGRFSLQLHRHYNLHVGPSERLCFIVDIFKIARWMVTVDAPVSNFHMVPSVRRATRNGHHVTWCHRGILKEYHNPREHVIHRILEVYAHRLQHVEWGEAVPNNSNAVLITRVAVRLKDALAAGQITQDDAIEHVRLAVGELHGVGYAHCDIVVENVFVDHGVAFLDDLEYLTPLADKAPLNARWDPARYPNLTAEGLDVQLLGSFTAEVLRGCC
jgi:hypothetical protein